MLGVVGAWAQETPVLTYENVTAPKDITSDATTILGLTGMTFVADVTITNSSDAQLLFAAVADYTSSNTANNSIWGLGLGGNSLRYIVGPRTGGWYSSDNGSLTTNAKKIIFTYDGTNNIIKYYVDGTWVKNQSSTKALSTFTDANAKLYLGGVVYNSSTEWGKFSGTISKVEIYNRVFSDIEIAEMCYPQEVVINPDRFENGRIYTFETSLGWMGARESDNNAISTALTSNNATGSANDPYFQWAVYKSDKENYYIYNVGKGMFLGEQSTTGNASVPMSNTPAIVTFKATLKGGYPLMFKTTDNANCVVNHSSQYGSGLITWNEGWNKTLDNGNCHIITDVGELDDDILATIKNAVDAYEADNTEAVAALSEAISTVEGWVVSNVGVGVGKYTYDGDGTFETKIQEYKDYRDGITEKNNPAPAEVEAKTVEVNTLLASFTLNMPEAGKFYTFNNGNNYITSGVTSGNRIALSGTKDVKAIYYYSDDHLLAYSTGKYIGLNSSDWTFEAIGSNDISNIVFVAAVNGATAKYNIQSGDRWLHKDNGFVNRCTYNTCGDAHNWTIEEVTSLPVTITSAGYATFYSPIAVTLPDGLKAYYVSETKGSYAKMEEINDVIPANTGVILEGTPNTYNLTIGGTAESVTNMLSGTVASEYITDDAYVLSMPTIDDVVQPVGFYKATKNQQSSTAWLNNGFKAYLHATAVASESRFLVFDFGDDMETGITETENGNVNAENYEVYDLAGRRVQNAQKGVFIVNGKMVVR